MRLQPFLCPTLGRLGVGLVTWTLMMTLWLSVISVSGLPEYITPKEKKGIDEFRPMVEHLFTQDFMSADAWLLTWLRARKLNLDDAKAMMERAMDWRRRTKVDTFLQEDWSQFDRDFKQIITCGTNRKGRPVIYIRWGRLDIRKAVLSGLSEKLLRYINYNIFEGPMKQSYEESKAAGRNLTTAATYLNDVGAFNLRQGLCLGCIPIQAQVAIAYELYYPQMFDKLLLINTPVIFDEVLRVCRPFLTQYTKEDMLVYRHDKDQWAPVVDKYIAIDQLPKALGGKKECKF